MTSTRPGCITGIAARRARVAASRSAVTARTSVDRDPRAVDRVGVVGRQLQRERGDRGHRAGQADQRRAPRRPAPSAAHLGQRGADVGLRAAAISLGRRRVAVQVPLGQPHAADVDRRAARTAVARRRARTRSSRRRCRRPGTAARRLAPCARAAASSEAVAPRKDSSASSRPVITSGVCARAIARTIVLEVGAVGGVAGGAGRHHPHRGRRRSSRGRRGVLGQHRAGCARCASGASRPVASTPWPSRTIRIAAQQVGVRAGRPGRRRRAAGSSWCRSRSAATRVTPSSPRLGAHGPGGPPLAHRRVERLVAERVDPGPGGQRVRDQHVQALDPVGHAAGGDARAAARRSASRVGQVGLVRARGSAAASSGSVASRPAISRIRPGRLQPARRRGRPRAGQVVQRRERRAVLQPRRGLDDVGLAARAPVRDRPSARGGRPSCRRDDGALGVGDRVGHPAPDRRRPPSTDSSSPSYQGSRSAGRGCRRRACRRRPSTASPSATMTSRSPGST